MYASIAVASLFRLHSTGQPDVIVDVAHGVVQSVNAELLGVLRPAVRPELDAARGTMINVRLQRSGSSFSVALETDQPDVMADVAHGVVQSVNAELLGVLRLVRP